jgi:hypothetical protein
MRLPPYKKAKDFCNIRKTSQIAAKYVAGREAGSPYFRETVQIDLAYDADTGIAGSSRAIPALQA